jgi:hypothetical protein
VNKGAEAKITGAPHVINIAPNKKAKVNSMCLMALKVL